MTEKNVFVVNDMTCNHCVGTIRKALEEAFPGTQVDIDLASHKVSVAGDKSAAESAIREAGYTPEAA